MINTNGLSDKEVLKSKELYGTNEISRKKEASFFSNFLSSLGDPIIKILLIALGIKLIFLLHDADWFETIGIFIAIMIATLISSISEYGSEKSFIKLQDEASKIKCKVKRNNNLEEISVDDIVKNDIVLLQTGDRIPADGIIIKGLISVDESSLNGEVTEIYKHENDEVLRGSVVCSNEALMLVEKIGENTIYGALAKELQDETRDSPLKLRLRHLAKIISRFGYIGALLVSCSYLFKIFIIDNNLINFSSSLIIDHFLYALTLAVTVIVVAVPEDCRQI